MLVSRRWDQSRDSLAVHGQVGCKVVTFEMQKRVAALMRTSLFLNNLHGEIELINHPVNEVPETLYYVENTANLGGTKLSGASSDTPGAIQVESVSIDGFVKERVEIVKMDVEGSEYHALLSMSSLFDNDLVGGILVEVRGTSIPQVDFLYERGYIAHRLTNLTTPLSRERLGEVMNGLILYEDFLFRK